MAPTLPGSSSEEAEGTVVEFECLTSSRTGRRESAVRSEAGRAAVPQWSPHATSVMPVAISMAQIMMLSRNSQIFRVIRIGRHGAERRRVAEKGGSDPARGAGFGESVEGVVTERFVFPAAAAKVGRLASVATRHAAAR